ncbi:MAG: class I SAM-dependent methyltransferase [Armatimonadetes bacterium]|nr:class I SAM-dependent methyltransferase [Akkermansiaceae bacterium]
MSKFFHLNPFLASAYYGSRWRVKQWLGIKVKPHTDVLSGGIDSAVTRYRRICETLLTNIPDRNLLQDAVVSEIGCGDCLAAADMMLGLGARHIHLVEFIPMVVSEEHRQALAPLVADSALPNQGSVLADGNPPRLNDSLVTFHEGLLEKIKLPQPVDFLYSFDVLEHVEDLDGFFAYCGEVIRPGGTMMHKFDLSGHGRFEDPMPPLDFQTMPRWLYELGFPKYNRAVGNFADQFLTSMEKHGFTDLKIIPIRVAEAAYLDEIWPHLRKEARTRSKEVLKLLDLIVLARKS